MSHTSPVLKHPQNRRHQRMHAALKDYDTALDALEARATALEVVSAAEIYLAANTIVTTIATVNVAVPIGNAQGATHPAAVLSATSTSDFALGTTGAETWMEQQTLVYTGPTGLYQVSFTASIASADASLSIFGARIAHEGSPVATSIMTASATSADTVVLKTSALISLATADTLQMLVVNNTDDDDLLVRSFQFHAVRV